MEVKTKKEEVKNIVDPEERDLISIAEEKISRLKKHEKELIESILQHNIQYCDVNRPHPNFTSSIGQALETVLNPQAAAFLLNFIINPQNIKIKLDELKKEELISDNTSKFVFELAAKYGGALRTIRLNMERSQDWSFLNSSVLISDSKIKLQSKISRSDGEVFQFDAPIEGILTFIEHFMRRTLETIKIIDKEIILEFDEAIIDSIKKQIDEIKEFHGSVKLEILDLEKNKETLTNDSSD